MNTWLLICNTNHFDIKKAFTELNNITWPQLNEAAVDDIVYFYATSPYRAVLYCCKIQEVNLYRMDKETAAYVSSPLFYESAQIYMRLEKIVEYPEDLITEQDIRNQKLSSLQSTSIISKELEAFIVKKERLFTKGVKKNFLIKVCLPIALLLTATVMLISKPLFEAPVMPQETDEVILDNSIEETNYQKEEIEVVKDDYTKADTMKSEIDIAEYILPNSDIEVLSVADLENLTREECRIARNEIYARHGRLFDDTELQAHFDSCSWYEGYIAGEDFNENMLSEVEIKNRDLIVNYEIEMNYRESNVDNSNEEKTLKIIRGVDFDGDWSTEEYVTVSSILMDGSYYIGLYVSCDEEKIGSILFPSTDPSNCDEVEVAVGKFEYQNKDSIVLQCVVYGSVHETTIYHILNVEYELDKAIIYEDTSFYDAVAELGIRDTSLQKVNENDVISYVDELDKFAIKVREARATPERKENNEAYIYWDYELSRWNTYGEIINDPYTAEEIVQKVKEYRIRNGLHECQFVEVDHEDEFGCFVVHCYDVVSDDEVTGSGHTATCNWYSINKYTLYGNDTISDEFIDLRE